MPINLNNMTFNNGGTAICNNTALSSIKYGSTEVWKKQYVVLGSDAAVAMDMAPYVCNPSDSSSSWINAEYSTNGNVYIGSTGHWTNGSCGWKSTISTVGYNAGAATTAQTVPCSQYSTMVVTTQVTGSAGTDGAGPYAFRIILKPTTGPNGLYTYQSLISGGGYAFDLNCTTSQTNATFSIANITQDLYLCVAVHVNSNKGSWKNIVTRIVFQ